MQSVDKLEPFLQLQDKLYPFVYDGISSVKIHQLNHKSFLLIVIGRAIYVIKPLNLLTNKMIVKDIFLIPSSQQHYFKLSEDIIDVGEVYWKIKKMKPQKMNYKNSKEILSIFKSFINGQQILNCDQFKQCLQFQGQLSKDVTIQFDYLYEDQEKAYYFFHDNTSLLKCIIFYFQNNNFNRELILQNQHLDKVWLFRFDLQSQGVSFIGIKEYNLYFVCFCVKKLQFQVQKFEIENKQKNRFSLLGSFQDKLVFLFNEYIQISYYQINNNKLAIIKCIIINQVDFKAHFTIDLLRYYHQVVQIHDLILMAFVDKIYALNIEEKIVYLIYDCKELFIVKIKEFQQTLYIITNKTFETVKHIQQYKYVFKQERTEINELNQPDGFLNGFMVIKSLELNQKNIIKDFSVSKKQSLLISLEQPEDLTKIIDLKTSSLISPLNKQTNTLINKDTLTETILNIVAQSDSNQLEQLIQDLDLQQILLITINLAKIKIKDNSIQIIAQQLKSKHKLDINLKENFIYISQLNHIEKQEQIICLKCNIIYLIGSLKKCIICTNIQ